MAADTTGIGVHTFEDLTDERTSVVPVPCAVESANEDTASTLNVSSECRSIIN